jgi:hypothetical protein
MSAFEGKADIKIRLILDFLIQCELRQEDSPLGPPKLRSNIWMVWVREISCMHQHRLIEFSVPLTFAIFFAHAASAQVTDRMKATAPEKMMPVDKALKMRECEKRMEQQKIKMEDRSRFLDECVWAKAK